LQGWDGIFKLILFNSLIRQVRVFQEGSGQSGLTAQRYGLFYCRHHRPTGMVHTYMHSRRLGKVTQLDATSHYTINLKGE
jgi:hypothetical protein